MRTLLTTTALVALLTTGALAQTAAPSTTSVDLLTQGYTVVDTDGLASKLLGFPVYSSAAADAERIGEINDLVIGSNGAVSAVIIGVGGFLGIGQKDVAVGYDALEWTLAADNTERIVLGATKEQLEAAVEVRKIDDDVAQAPAGATAPVASGEVHTPGEPLNRTGLVDLDETTLTADQLLGTNVYGPGDEHIGTIADFAFGEGNAIDAVIIDFGGFLGIGTKPVAVAFEDLQFYADQNGENRSLVLNVTREQMEAAPAFNRDTYTNERNLQRIIVAPTTTTAG